MKTFAYFSTCSSLVFEKAYCQYRLNKNSEALATLDNSSKLDLRCKELKAQLVRHIMLFFLFCLSSLVIVLVIYGYAYLGTYTSRKALCSSLSGRHVVIVCRCNFVSGSNTIIVG